MVEKIAEIRFEQRVEDVLERGRADRAEDERNPECVRGLWRVALVQTAEQDWRLHRDRELKFVGERAGSLPGLEGQQRQERFLWSVRSDANRSFASLRSNSPLPGALLYREVFSYARIE